MNESLLTIKFEDYIELLDRILDTQGIKEDEREIIFNDNANLISTSFKKRVHPRDLIKELNLDSIVNMYHNEKNNYEDIYNDEEEEEKYIPSIYYESLLVEKSKKKSPLKFKKVMKEFGKGKLKPYHSDSALKSKEQNGSKKEHKQALAIAFSEAGMKKK